MLVCVCVLVSLSMVVLSRIFWCHRVGSSPVAPTSPVTSVRSKGYIKVAINGTPAIKSAIKKQIQIRPNRSTQSSSKIKNQAARKAGYPQMTWVRAGRCWKWAIAMAGFYSSGTSTCIWGFPKIGLLPNHPLLKDFPKNIPSSYWGTLHFWKPPYDHQNPKFLRNRLPHNPGYFPHDWRPFEHRFGEVMSHMFDCQVLFSSVHISDPRGMRDCIYNLQ